VRCRREALEAEAAEAVAAQRANQRLIAGGLVAFVLLSAVAVAGVRAWEGRTRAAAPITTPNAPPSITTDAVASSGALAPLEPAKVTADPTPAAAPSASSALARAMHAESITMYCRPAPNCAHQRAWFQQRGLLYRERNVDVDPAAAAFARKIAPDGTLPVFEVDRQSFAGTDDDRLVRAVAYAAAVRLQR
jgi:hypothetical protein